MHYHDEIFAILASKLNNDIARTIMKSFKTPMQCLFETAYDLKESTIIPLEKDNYFTTFRDARYYYYMDIGKHLNEILRLLQISYFSYFQMYGNMKLEIFLHYQFLLTKIVMENKFNPNTTLFVIKNNKIFLKKGEYTAMRMAEIVDLTGKVAIYSGRSTPCILEKGDTACSFLTHCFEGWAIYAIEDVSITFDSYIMNNEKFAFNLINKSCNVTNFCYTKDKYYKVYDKYKYISQDDIKKYNLPKDFVSLNHINGLVNFDIIDKDLYNSFLWQDTKHIPFSKY